MKKILSCILSIALAAVISFGLTGCFGIGDNQTDDEPKDYMIQYTDGSGIHTLTVTEGLLYALDEIPQKTGYTFTGLFDAEVNGVQYVSASGTSIAPFNAGKNIVLYPQFKANEYTVILDYQGAAVTGVRQISVEYGGSIAELPLDLTLANKDFAGWYTEADCKGVLIADRYGIVPSVSVMNEKNFNLDGGDITLYAGFSTQIYSVTCYFGNGIEPETVEVEYGASVNDISVKTRVDGKAPLSWSKTQNGAPFTGIIESDTNLYASEYAPVIDFDVNGGNSVNAIVARAGAAVSLPVPAKELAKFLYWEDAQGKKYETTQMPEESITVKAVWQGKIVFEENGGTVVEDISVKAGEKIKLPVSEKAGYIFAGWYTADKERYTSTQMPVSGIALKAGWYKAVMDNRVDKIKTSKDITASDISAPTTSYLWFKISLSQYLGTLNSVTVKIDGQFKFASIAYGGGSATPNTNIYSENMVNSDYLLWSKSYDSFSGNYNFKTYNFSTTLTVSNDVYICFYLSNRNTNLVSIKEFYFTVTYPDTTNLYL